MAIYLTKENFKQRWEDSKAYMAPFFEPIAEFERIARNRPHPGMNKAYPKNTDGTLAGIIDANPKRTIQQIPTGKVTTPQGTVQSIVADFILNSEIIPNANTDADALQKCWAVVSKSMSFGATGAMSLFAQHDNDFGGDFKLFYVKDGFFQAGKLTFMACDYFFVRGWYQECDIDNLIEKEKKSKQTAKENGEKYEAEWDSSTLARAKKWISEKSDEAKSSGEKEHNARTQAIEIIHGFQKGVGGKFFSYAVGTDEFVGERKNKDPRGKMPVHYMYTVVDFENPLGRGVVEMSGGTQNVIDSMLQAYQYNRALMLAPPLIKRGNWNKNQAKLAPNAVIDMGSAPENSLEPLKLDTTALNNFSQDYSLFKSQILALNNNGDTSTSSEVGNPGFSKTSAGVDAQQLKLGVSDNYMRKQFESFWGDVCESMLNLHFANKHGVEEIELDDDTARKVREIDPSLVDENSMYVINYDEYTEGLKFSVDASTSNKETAQTQIENIDKLLERIEGSPMLQAIMQQYPEKQAEIYNTIIGLSGIEDAEKLEVDAQQFGQEMEEQKAMAEQQAMQAAQAQAMSAQMPPEAPMNTAAIPEGEVVPGEESDPMQDPRVIEALQGLQGSEEEMLPLEQEETGVEGQLPDEMLMSQNGDEEAVIEEALQDGSLTEEEEQFVQGLQERGFDSEVIAMAVVMLQEDVPEEEIVQIIGMSRGGEE
jgi:hypothetical protein